MALLRSLGLRVPPTPRQPARVTIEQENAFAPRIHRLTPVIVPVEPEVDLERPATQAEIAAEAHWAQSSAFEPTTEDMPPLPSLKALLDSEDNMPEPARYGGTREGYTHLSSLITACTRREILATQSGRTLYNTVTGGHRLVWAYGRAAEKHVRTQYIKATRGNLYGEWVCPTCEHSLICWGDELPRSGCQHCGPNAREREYREVPIHDHERLIVGNADMPLKVTGSLGGEYLVIGECKSMNKPDWDALTTPVPDHVLQAASYRRLYQQQGWQVHSHVIILYAVKEFRFGSPYKEFHVDATTGLVETQVDGIFATAEEIASHRRENALPPRTVCQSPENPLSKQCPLAALCFGIPG